MLENKSNKEQDMNSCIGEKQKLMNNVLWEIKEPTAPCCLINKHLLLIKEERRISL